MHRNRYRLLSERRPRKPEGDRKQMLSKKMGGIGGGRVSSFRRFRRQNPFVRMSAPRSDRGGREGDAYSRESVDGTYKEIDSSTPTIGTARTTGGKKNRKSSNLEKSAKETQQTRRERKKEKRAGCLKGTFAGDQCSLFERKGFLVRGKKGTSIGPRKSGVTEKEEDSIAGSPSPPVPSANSECLLKSPSRRNTP